MQSNVIALASRERSASVHTSPRKQSAPSPLEREIRALWAAVRRLRKALQDGGPLRTVRRREDLRAIGSNATTPRIRKMVAAILARPPMLPAERAILRKMVAAA
jgi:hypothetical protein